MSNDLNRELSKLKDFVFQNYDPVGVSGKAMEIYNDYALQLSTYAWMLQMINPDFVIKDLILVHFDHNDNQTVYNMPYLKKEVESMLKFYKKSIFKQEKLAKLKKIEY